mmetsp:Transcript_8108/g.17499  ORF Transcript_8108/g.17499 Transcript_8108/m.17499 type:complete len:110 (+) Transcript_8108:979-1308(+)
MVVACKYLRRGHYDIRDGIETTNASHAIDCVVPKNKIYNNSQLALCYKRTHTCLEVSLPSRPNTLFVMRVLLMKTLYAGVFNPDQELVFANLHSLQPVALHSRSNNRNQ